MTNRLHRLAGRGLAGLAVLTLVACADTTGRIVPIGHGSYKVSSRGEMGFSPTSMQEAKAHEQADAFCEQQNKVMKLLSENDTYGDVGVSPAVELEFQCAPRK